MKADDRSSPETRSAFRSAFVRVMTVQVVTLVVLWLLQSRYSG